MRDMAVLTPTRTQPAEPRTAQPPLDPLPADGWALTDCWRGTRRQYHPLAKLISSALGYIWMVLALFIATARLGLASPAELCSLIMAIVVPAMDKALEDWGTATRWGHARQQPLLFLPGHLLVLFLFGVRVWFITLLFTYDCPTELSALGHNCQPLLTAAQVVTIVSLCLKALVSTLIFFDMMNRGSRFFPARVSTRPQNGDGGTSFKSLV